VSEREPSGMENKVKTKAYYMLAEKKPKLPKTGIIKKKEKCVP
jgi:hypothetical protein